MSIEDERERITNRHPIWHYNPSLGWGDVPYSVAPYVPTPLNVVKIMLNLVNANTGDILFDLGCGDGRILFTAVEDFGVKKAVGYDLNSAICKVVQDKIENKGLNERVVIINDNFFNANLSMASIVTLYLTTSGNSKLKPKLEKELKKGTRIVSHDFPIHGWITKNVDPPYHYTVGSHKIFVYQIPEAYQDQRVLNRKPDESSRWKKLKKIFLKFNE